MIPDGWVVIVPMLPSGVQVLTFRSEDHAREIFDGLRRIQNGVELQPIFFTPDER